MEVGLAGRRRVCRCGFGPAEIGQANADGHPGQDKLDGDVDFGDVALERIERGDA